ncbi:MAG: PepSY-associated TM helix domain-containing protein [Luteimonas sp.]
MNPDPRTAATTPRSPNNLRTHRWIRQIHLWIGAWGALAAIVYGLTGLVMNHRSGDNPWPQGESIDIGRTELTVPAAARTSAEDLSLWLRKDRGLDAKTIRKGAPRGAPNDAPEQWTLSGGNARESWSLQYKPGDASAEVKHSRQTWLAVLNRLHKAVGGGYAWVLLADSFGIAMLLLGLSGIWMWARGRTARQLVMSVMGVSTLVLLMVLWPALA